MCLLYMAANVEIANSNSNTGDGNGTRRDVVQVMNISDGHHINDGDALFPSLSQTPPLSTVMTDMIIDEGNASPNPQRLASTDDVEIEADTVTMNQQRLSNLSLFESDADNPNSIWNSSQPPDLMKGLLQQQDGKQQGRIGNSSFLSLSVNESFPEDPYEEISDVILFQPANFPITPVNATTANSRNPNSSSDLLQNHKEPEWTRSDRIRSSFPGIASNCSAKSSDRICGCSASCLLVNNCCFDSEFVNNHELNVTEIKPRYSCYSDVSKKWTFAYPSRLVDKCEASWKNENIRGFCEGSPEPNDIYSYVPCFSQTTGVSYRNVYCLQCNGLNDCSLWQVMFQAGFPLQFKDIDTYEKMTRWAGKPLKYRGKQFVLKPKDTFEPSHCVPSAIGQCKPEYTTDIMNKLCLSYYNPVKMQYVLYRNIDCFRCYTGKMADVDFAIINRVNQQAMSALLDLQQPNSVSRTGNSCPGNNCPPVISRIRGYYQRKTFYILIKIPDKTYLPKPEEIEDIDKATAEALMENAAANLKDFSHTVRLMSWQFKLQSVLPASLRITITEDIPVDVIGRIQHAINSVGFEFSIRNHTFVSCCTYEHDESIDDKENIDSPKKTHTGNSSAGQCPECDITTVQDGQPTNCYCASEVSNTYIVLASLLACLLNLKIPV